MLNGDGDGNKNSKKNQQVYLAAHFFSYFFLDVVLLGYNVKLPSNTSYEGNVVHVCAHQKFCCLCSCSLFFTAAHFRLAGHQHFSFSHRQFSCFSSNEIRLLCFFIQRCSSVSVIHVSKDVFVQSDLTLLLFFSLKCPGGHAISRQKTPCCIWVALPVD